MANQNFKVKKGLEVGTALTATSDGLNVTGIITATQFSGDGSGLTGVTAAGSGVVVQEEGSNVGTAATINFIGSNVTAALSGGIANVTVSAGGLSNVVEDTTPQLGGNLDLNSKDITGTGNISITGGINATGVSTFQENVTFQSHASFGDDDKANFGDGNDLQIYHNSSNNNSVIAESGSGNLNINASRVNFQNAVGNETLGVFREDGSVSLNYDNSRKFETTGYGATVFGTLQSQQLNVSGIATAGGGVRVPANSNIRATTDDSIVIVGDEGIRNGIQISGTTGIGVTEAYIDASGRFVSHADTGEFYLTGSSDTGGTNYFNATSTGTYVGGSQLDPGASNIFLGVGTTSHFLGNVGIGETQPTAKLDVNGNANISGTVSFGSTVTLGDNKKLTFGNDDDLKIYHEVTESAITNDTGRLFIRNNADDEDILLQTDDGSGGVTSYLRCDGSEGSVKIYYYGSSKIVTTNHGAIITGVATATSFSGSGSSLTGLTGASAGTYGASNNTPIITVDSNGRITGISTVATAGAGGGGGISNIVEDTTPQLGGNLDLNSKDITGSGDIDYTGNLKVTGISTITGVAGFSSHVTLPDHAKIKIGTSSDLQIYHDGANSHVSDQGTGDLRLSGNVVKFNNQSNTATMVKATQGGAVQLYHNNALRLQTTGTGVNITDDLNVAGISTFADNAYFGDEVTINRSTTNTALSIKNSNVLKGRLTPEGSAFKVSANGTNDLNLQSNDSGGTSGDVVISTAGVSGSYIAGTGKVALFSGSGTAELYYQDSKKFETTNTGATVTGTLTATAFSGDGSALTNLPASGITTSQSNTQVTYNVGASGNNYVITGPGYNNSDNNPDLYLVRGQRYRFINATGASHPFRIQSDTSGTAYTDGVSGSQSGTQEFNVQHDAPSRLFYQCTIHSGMIGNIYITGGGQWENTSVAASGTPKVYTDYNVGIGTDNPDATLKVNVASGNNGVVVQNTSTANIALFGARNGDATVQIGQWGSTASGSTFGLSNANLSFIYTTSYSTTHPSALALGTVSNKPIVFATNNTERVRITSAGTLKVGSNTLVTPSTDADNFVIDTGDVDSGISILSATTGRIYFGDASNNDTGSIRYVHTDNSMRFETNDEEKLRITSGGFVGINVINPSTNLQIGGTTVDSDNVLKFGKRVSSNEGNLPLIGHHSHNGTASGLALCATSSSGCIYFFTGNDSDGFGDGNNKERLRITSGGSVAIGTDNPQSLLSLHQSGGGFEVNANSGSNNARLLSYDRPAGAFREMTFQAESYGFETSGSERLRIAADGDVRIGNYNSVNRNSALSVNTSNSRLFEMRCGNGTETNFVKRYGFSFIRTTSESTHNLVSLGSVSGNSHVIIQIRMYVVSAVANQAAIITAYAHARQQHPGTSYTYNTQTPTAQFIVGTGIGVGSLQWTNGVLQYNTDANNNYTKYNTEITAWAHDRMDIGFS